jgi:hypothetical protein
MPSLSLERPRVYSPKVKYGEFKEKRKIGIINPSDSFDLIFVRILMSCETFSLIRNPRAADLPIKV